MHTIQVKSLNYQNVNRIIMDGNIKVMFFLTQKKSCNQNLYHTYKPITFFVIGRLPIIPITLKSVIGRLPIIPIHAKKNWARLGYIL